MKPVAFSAVVLLVLATTASAWAAPPTKQECVALNEDAQDLRRSGRLRAAIGRFELCVDPSCPAPVREDCATRLAEAQEAVPKIVFVARDERGNPVTAVRVSMDRIPLTERLDGSAVPVESGEHTFELLADGFAPQTRVLRVADGTREEVNVVLTAAAPRPPATDPRAPGTDASDGSTQRTIGWLVGGAGVVGIGVGSVFGLMAKDTYDDAKVECGGTPSACPDASAREKGNDAHDQAAVSTIAFAAGAALLVGGVVLYLTAPRRKSVLVGSSGTSLWLGARW